MRILHIGKFFPPHHGGMEVFLADLIAEQRAQGLDVAALVHGDPLPTDPPWLTRVPVQLHLIYAPIALGFRSALVKLIKNFKPDILHLHMPNTSVFWALTLESAKDIPWVVHWHSDVVASKLDRRLALLYQLYRPFEQAILDGAERIIVTSPPYLEASEPLAYWRPKCEVIPLGLDNKRIPIGLEESLECQWKPNCFRVLAIGRLTYYKGFDILVQAVAGQKNVQLIILGDGELRSSLESLLETLTPNESEPSISLLGSVDDQLKFSLLKSCDVLCLPSRERTEAFGMVLLEAMAFSKPCIVSDLAGSGVPWVIDQTGAGIKVQVDSVSAWQAALASLVRDKNACETLGKNGNAVLHKRFLASHAGMALTESYAQIVEAESGTEGKDKILFVMPAKNEALSIGNLLQEMLANGWKNILVIDDQSTDRTSEIAKSLGVKVIRAELPLGAWGAMQTGIRYALKHGYKAVITMDADGQHEASEIAHLVQCADAADVVIGAFPQRASTARRLAWHWFRLIARLKLQDLTSGFRYFNQNAMSILASEEATLLEHQDMGTLLMLRKAGLKFIEIQVNMRMRQAGASRIFNSWFSVGRYMGMTTLLCLSRWNIRRATNCNN